MYIKVYLILAHKKPKQLNQLISLLEDGNSVFFIHLDKKVDIRQFEIIRNLENCVFVKQREKGSWGGFGIVQGTLNGMKEIKDHMNQKYPDYGYHCIILSGEDLPVKSNTYIHDFLKGKQEFSLLNYWELPYNNWWKGGLFRFEKLYCFDYVNFSNYNRWLNKLVKKLRFNFLLPLNRLRSSFPNIKLYGSSQWMILSKIHLEKLCNETKELRKLRKIFKTVLLPDETFIITYTCNFLNLDNLKLKNVKPHLIIFQATKNNPKYLSVSDIEAFQDENMLFARKFSLDKNPEAINYIINHLNS